MELLREEGRHEIDQPEKEGFLYRAYYEARTFDGHFPSRWVTIRFDELRIVRKTPKGFWIDHPDNFGKPMEWKWVSSEGIKRYAYPTKQEAMKSLLMRKRRYLSILKTKIEVMKYAIEILEKLIGETK